MRSCAFLLYCVLVCAFKYETIKAEHTLDEESSDDDKLTSDHARRYKRGGALRYQDWPGAIVKYEIGDGFTAALKLEIYQAMAEYERYTCVKFEPKGSADQAYVQITSDKGCYADIGYRRNGRTLCVLGSCRQKIRSNLHELGHTLGLVHEQVLPQRDQYVRILTDNIKPQYLENFRLQKESYIVQGAPYDFQSLMHYQVKQFNKKKKNSMEILNPANAEILKKSKNQLESYGDLYTVNKFYKCADRCPQKDKCGDNGFLDVNCNCVCQDGTQNCDKTKAPTQPNTNCKNKYYSNFACMIWANSEPCTDDQKKDCAMSCGVCQSGSTKPKPTQNKYDRCAVWGRNGLCDVNPTWMKENCVETCR